MLRGLGCGLRVSCRTFGPHVNSERLMRLRIESLNIGCSLDSHHMVEGRLLTRKLRLVIVTLGHLSCLFHLLLALLDLFSFSLRHSLGWRQGLRFWNG